MEWGLSSPRLVQRGCMDRSDAFSSFDEFNKKGEQEYPLSMFPGLWGVLL
jgi:hypothetical protein